jgi:DivIVA domain-containing protein
MSYTPVEIRHVKLRRGLRGYRRAQVDHLLEEVTDSFENVWRERADY